VPESNVTVLSIVCVTAFDLIRFSKTFDSVSTFQGNLELLVICPEGDRSVIELVSQESRKMSYPVKIFHDPGTGIYPAMNIGLKNCAGKYVIFWNSGDVSGGNLALSEFISYLESLEVGWGIAQGSFTWRDEIELTQENIFAFFLQAGGYISHQTVFAKKDSLSALGGFNEKFNVSADTDLITKLYIRYGEPVFFTRPVVEVEFPEFSGRHHRRGRIENIVIALTVLPFKFKFQGCKNAIRKEFQYIRRRLNC
jgi:putative colanic acid biosynthesis glycosyltransferase